MSFSSTVETKTVMNEDWVADWWGNRERGHKKTSRRGGSIMRAADVVEADANRATTTDGGAPLVGSGRLLDGSDKVFVLLSSMSAAMVEG
jgi:hypothetical protein